MDSQPKKKKKKVLLWTFWRASFLQIATSNTDLGPGLLLTQVLVLISHFSSLKLSSYVYLISLSLLFL